MTALSRHTPHLPTQREPIPGREAEMVRNDAGGFVFRKDVWTRLADFLVLGTEGGTYYANERKHTYSNIASLREAVALDGVRAVSLAVDTSTSRPPRAPKNYPALYAVAFALANGDVDARRAAADAVPQVARTTDHLAHLFGYYKSLKGKIGAGGGVGVSSSPVVRRAWAGWFTARTPDAVAYTFLKGRQRKTGDGETFRPADLLRLSKPVPRNEVENALFALVSGKQTPMDASGHLSAAKAFYEAQLADTPAKAVRAINAYHVPWEFLPDEVLGSAAVWEALVPHLGITALIRNLSRMTQLGTLGPFRPANQIVARRLTDQSELHRGRVHPFDLMLALKVYESGRAQPNDRAPIRTWTPVPSVVDALNAAYAASFAVAEQIPHRLVVAVDRSGSMSWPVSHGGSSLGSAFHVGSAVAQILMRTAAPDAVWPLDFDSSVRASRLRADMSLSQVFQLGHSGGTTDLAAPIRWALDHAISVDGFVIVTDGETWAGPRHATHVLDAYRRRINPSARVIVVSTTASGTTIGDPRDPGVLNVAGFDSALPALISGWLRPAGPAAGEDSR